jgi:hypothetical protein
MKELEVVLNKLKKELRDNKTRVSDLLSQNSAYDAAIMFIEEAIENDKRET